MDAKTKATCATFLTYLSWLLSTIGFTGYYVGKSFSHLTDGTDSKAVGVLILASIGFVSLTASAFHSTQQWCFKDVENTKWRFSYIGNWVASLCYLVSFSLAATAPNVFYGYGFGLFVFVWLTTGLAGFFGFITDRDLGHV